MPDPYEMEAQEDFYSQINDNEKKTVKTEWSTHELRQDFKVIGFSHGYCAVERLSDGQKGSFDFGGSPRKYYNFIEAN